MCPRTGRTVFGNWERTEDERKVSKALEEVAKQVGAQSIQAGQSLRSPAQLSAHLFLFFPTLITVAIAYVMQKTPYVFPVIGGRKPEHLRANLEALSIALTDEHLKQLDGVVPLPPTFPYTLIVSALRTVCWRRDLTLIARIRACRVTGRNRATVSGTQRSSTCGRASRRSARNEGEE